jgi:hypothetical protein
LHGGIELVRTYSSATDPVKSWKLERLLLTVLQAPGTQARIDLHRTERPGESPEIADRRDGAR